MSAQFSRRVVIVVAVLTLTAAAAPAWGQQNRDVQLSPVEVSFGLTINALKQDANAPPDCVNLSLPCTDESSRQMGGFGAAVSVTRNVTDRFAITSDFSRYANGWDSWDSLRANRRAVNHVTSMLVGPKVSTGFYYPGNGDREPGRFFGQILAGAQASDVAPVRPAFLIGGGVDFIVPHGSSRGVAPGPTVDLTFRMAIDYCITPGAGRNLSGYRFVFGMVFGPRFK
jgi:hypothetical protein